MCRGEARSMVVKGRHLERRGWMAVAGEMKGLAGREPSAVMGGDGSELAGERREGPRDRRLMGGSGMCACVRRRR